MFLSFIVMVMVLELLLSDDEFFFFEMWNVEKWKLKSYGVLWNKVKYVRINDSELLAFLIYNFYRSYAGTPVPQRSSSHSNSSAEYYSSSSTKRNATIATSNFFPTQPQSLSADHRSQLFLTDYVTSQRLCDLNDAFHREKSSYFYPPRQGIDYDIIFKNLS